MGRVVKYLFLSAAVALVWAPAEARADGYVSPFAGITFGAGAVTNGRGAYGADAGWMGGGIIGGEVDLGYLPHFFGDQGTLGTNYIVDLMGNVNVGIPVGGQHGAGIRPYGTIGFGLMRSSIAGSRAILAISNNDPGINAGAGVMGYFNDHVGLRGDVRYFRDVHNNGGVNQLNIDFGGLHFWRASIGLVLR
jgi:hypothetical protein